jgi:hypothetical protein
VYISIATTSNFMVCSKLLFSVEAIRRCFSNTTGRYRAQQTQREDASSLPAAGFARHPSPTSAGLFMPATPALRIARGPTPTRPQAVSPIFRAELVQTSAIAPPFPLRPAPLQGWGYPSACACYPPAFARWRSAFGIKCGAQARKQRSNRHDKQKVQRGIPAPRPSEHSRVHYQPAQHFR